MAQRKRTKTPSSLNTSFRESLVKTISSSLHYNADGRSVITRTLETVDGEVHTFTQEVPAEIALKHLSAAFTEYTEWSAGSFKGIDKP